jgi:uncharacterized repeat protein (TIGR04138 family)
MHETFAFHIAVREACRRDSRFAPEAYGFLCQVLQHTVKMVGREEEENRHVNGPELLAGWRDLAVLEFGPMASFVMREWRVTRSEDVGAMVFHFIDIGYFGRNKTDCVQDFSDGVDMDEALRRPFQLTRV